MLQHRPLKTPKTDRNDFKMFCEKECDILIKPHWLSDTGNISLKTCTSDKQTSTNSAHSFVYRICNSLGKYFLYLKVSVVNLYILRKKAIWICCY